MGILSEIRNKIESIEPKPNLADTERARPAGITITPITKNSTLVVRSISLPQVARITISAQPKTLAHTTEEIIVPDDACLFVCRGALIDKEKKEQYTKKEIEELITKLKGFKEESSQSLRPLFKTKKEHNEFVKRHEKSKVKRTPLEDYTGDVFIGIDSGSTTAKLVAIDYEGNLQHTYPF